MASGFAAEQVWYLLRSISTKTNGKPCWLGEWQPCQALPPLKPVKLESPLQVSNVDTPILALTSSLVLIGRTFYVSVAAFCPVECIKSLPASNAPT
jgi:hypothetical protein